MKWQLLILILLFAGAAVRSLFTIKSVPERVQNQYSFSVIYHAVILVISACIAVTVHLLTEFNLGAVYIFVVAVLLLIISIGPLPKIWFILVCAAVAPATYKGYSTIEIAVVLSVLLTSIVLGRYVGAVVFGAIYKKNIGAVATQQITSRWL
ncbi:hypothetical protein NBRC116494_12100 [Aurantivibrio plasticivorans]